MANVHVPRRSRRVLIGCLAALTSVAVAAPPIGAARGSGFRTSQAPMLRVLAEDGAVKPIITVGETIGSYLFDAIPDGIALRRTSNTTAQVWVNHELSKVPFGGVDYENSILSELSIHRGSAKILSARYAIPSSANYQRFCSNYLVTVAEGFDRPLLFTNEEARDFVNRTGPAWPPAAESEPPAEQAGVVVAYDPANGQYKTIYGMGRHNHENTVQIPGYNRAVLLSGDDTFDAPASQLYMYLTDENEPSIADAVWNDEGHLWAFRSDDPNTNDYGDLTGSESVSGEFIFVQDNIADGVPGGLMNGPQASLENWGNDSANNVFQFIRVEDIAYDRNDPHVIYIADTGEPRANNATSAGTGRLTRSGSTFRGPYMNGRIYKMVLNDEDPTQVDSLSILIDADAGGYNNPNVVHQPDNLETTKNSLLITEDPGGHNQRLGSFTNATNARVWRYDLATGVSTVVAEVDQSADEGPTDVDPATTPGAAGAWEASGIVDASAAFGPGTFLIDVQAHTLFVNFDDVDNDKVVDTTERKREGGQLLLIRIPGA